MAYEIQQNIDRFHSFDAFSRGLWAYDYKAEKSEKFLKDVVEAQLLNQVGLTIDYSYIIK